MTKMDWERERARPPSKDHSMTAYARTLRPRAAVGVKPSWKCPVHGITVHYVAAGVSKKGFHYPEFWSCSVRGCGLTSTTTKSR